VIERFRTQRSAKLSEIRHRKYLSQVADLKEKIAKTKEKKTLSLLNEELRLLSHVPAPDPSLVLPLETIQSQATRLLAELADRESQLMDEDALEASMLCEVVRLNLLNLLRIFEAGVEVAGSEGNGNEESAEMISNLQKEVSELRKANSVLRSDLNRKVGNLSMTLPSSLETPSHRFVGFQEDELRESQSVVLRFQRKEGTGLPVTSLPLPPVHPLTRSRRLLMFGAPISTQKHEARESSSEVHRG
jgi:hypothetical protein